MTTKTDPFSSLGPIVMYYPSLARVVGIKPAILAGHLLSWAERSEEGWVQKSADELTDETGLTYEEQRSARAELRRRGVLEERHQRLEHHMYYRLNLGRLADVIEEGAR